MTNQELPEVNSVWQHNETGEIRQYGLFADGYANSLKCHTVYYSKFGHQGCFTCSLDDWIAWQKNATRLSPSQPLDVSRLSGPELFWLKTKLAELQVFGPWQKVDEATWGRELAGSTRYGGMPVIVKDALDGFRWEIAVGTVGNWWREEMGGPFPILSAAQAACDAVLRKSDVLLVD